MVSSNQESQADSVEKYYLEEAGSARDSKFIVKLKIPKSNEGIEEGETASSVVRKEHYCADCDKSFSSGKALGGHMSSAHVQAGKDYQSKKLRLKNPTKFKQHGSAPSADIGVGDGAKKIVCKICGKDFPSRKSLYGHMRCHPDREYRGMQPPESKKTHLSSPSDHVDEFLREEVKDDSPFLETSPFFSSDYDDEESLDQAYGPIDPVGKNSPMVDLSKFLTCWAVTGQRGRQANNPGIASPQDPSLSSAEAEELSEAAYSLVNLGNGTHPRYKEDDKSEGAEDTNSNSMTPDAKIEDVKPKKQRKEVYPAKKAQDFPVKPIKIGGTKPNPDADYYEDVKRASKSKRQRIEGPPSTDERKFSPFKKLTTGKRKPETQILQQTSYKGKGKAPMEHNLHEFRDAICESEDEDFGTGSDYMDKSSADDSDSEKTPEQQNQKYIEYRKKNGFVPYNKRLEKGEGKEKPLNTEPETNLGPVAEKKDATAEFTPEKYKCSTCNKCFQTHQALGGHRSSHNKLRVSIQNTIDDSSPENQSNAMSQILEAKEGSTPGLNLTENHHQCQICNKNFSSGQALGGHMRCHATGPASQAASAEEDIQSVRKVLKFDLNELPDIEDADSKDGGN